MLPFLTSAPRRVLLPILLAASGLCGGAAQAGGVQWSVGIQLPEPPVVYYPAPPQRVYAPAPVYVRQEPQVIYVEPQRPRHHHHWRDEDGWDRGGDNRWNDGRGEWEWRHGR